MGSQTKSAQLRWELENKVQAVDDTALWSWDHAAHQVGGIGTGQLLKNSMRATVELHGRQSNSHQVCTSPRPGHTVHDVNCVRWF